METALNNFSMPTNGINLVTPIMEIQQLGASWLKELNFNGNVWITEVETLSCRRTNRENIYKKKMHMCVRARASARVGVHESIERLEAFES